jgi:hypothetical protein
MLKRKISFRKRIDYRNGVMLYFRGRILTYCLETIDFSEIEKKNGSLVWWFVKGDLWANFKFLIKQLYFRLVCYIKDPDKAYHYSRIKPYHYSDIKVLLYSKTLEFGMSINFIIYVQRYTNR